MQHNKSTKKLEQIEKISKTEGSISENISSTMEKFSTNKTLKKFDILKRSGKLISTLTITLLLLPFVGASSIADLFTRDLSNVEGNENAYYDVKNNEKINWRSFLISMAQRFMFLINTDNELLNKKEEAKKIKAIIFDDTSLEKTGKHIEGIGFVYDHVKHLHIRGFKLLVGGFFDGRSFIPLDFYILNENRKAKLDKLKDKLEKKKNKLELEKTEIQGIRKQLKINKTDIFKANQTLKTKPNKTNERALNTKKRIKERLEKKITNKQKEKKKLVSLISELTEEYSLQKTFHCGIKEKEYKQQYKKKRDRNTAGYRRKLELNEDKITASIKMLKRMIKKGFIADYVLTDSWFFCKKMLDAVIETGRLHLVSMARIGTAKYEILATGQELNPHEIITKYERKQSKYSRKHKSTYIVFQAKYQGVRVKIFLIKFGRHAHWRMLVTTDTKMSFTRIIEVYQVRWTIEVFFKESKQLLYLGKSQSRDFDGQLVDITLSLVRYIFLSYYERIHYGMTIGGIFRKLSQMSVEENLLADISFFFHELLKIFADNAGIDFIAFYEDLLRDPKANEIILKIGLKSEKQAA